MIEVRDLVYEYPSKRALEHASLSVPAQTITALVGPNGAGKTTLLRCLAALEPPYSGSVTIAGLDTREQPRRIHTLLGYLPDFFGLYDDLTVRRCLTYAAWSHGIAPVHTGAAVEKAAGRVSLSDRIPRQANCRAGFASVSPSARPSSTNPRCCSSTNRRQVSILRHAAISRPCSFPSKMRA